jgi:hypothetical protein
LGVGHYARIGVVVTAEPYEFSKEWQLVYQVVMVVAIHERTDQCCETVGLVHAGSTKTKTTPLINEDAWIGHPGTFLFIIVPSTLT